MWKQNSLPGRHTIGPGIAEDMKPTMIGLPLGPCRHAPTRWWTGRHRAPMTRSGSYPAAITKDAQINEAATSWLYQDLLDFFFFGGGNRGNPRQNRCNRILGGKQSASNPLYPLEWWAPIDLASLKKFHHKKSHLEDEIAHDIWSFLSSENH